MSVITEAFQGVKQREYTERQVEVLQFVDRFISEEGYSPSYREICDHFLFGSLNSVKRHLDALSMKGAINHTPNVARSIVITDKGKEVLAA